MFEWTTERIDWYERALSYTGYASLLAEELIEYLPISESVCDLGCGTGYLARELALRGYEVWGADRSRLALNVLRKEKDRLNLHKLSVLEANWADIKGTELWDNVIMVSAGHFDSELMKYLSLCKKRLILVVKEDKSSHVLPKGQKSALRKRDYLVSDLLKDFEYSVKSFYPEFGQPLLSMDEAKKYISYFGGDVESEKSALGRVIQTGRADYPYYLPNKSEKLIYVIQKEG